MATVDLGKISFVNKGTYDASTTYEERDVVQFTDGALSSSVSLVITIVNDTSDDIVGIQLPENIQLVETQEGT